MNMKTLLLTSLFSLASMPAFAYHCPMDMKKIDAALAQNPNLSSLQLAEVNDLRARGEAAHRAGNHKQSVDLLARAMQILQIR